LNGSAVGAPKRKAAFSGKIHHTDMEAFTFNGFHKYFYFDTSKRRNLLYQNKSPVFKSFRALPKPGMFLSDGSRSLERGESELLPRHVG